MLKNPVPLSPSGQSAGLSPIPYHPCLNDEAHCEVARIHLPVAPRCNLACAYCERILSSDPSLPGPGTATAVVDEAEAVDRALRFLREYGPDSIVGIAGPGDPLANGVTFTCLERLKEVAPGAKTCLCTNGLALPAHVDRLIDLGVKTLTVTVNGVSAPTVAAMQPRVFDGGEWIGGEAGAELLLARQREGVRRAAAAGIVVKINMVVAPEINMDEAGAVADAMAALGARVFNPMPLIPRHALKACRRPTGHELEAIRGRCGQRMYVFTQCKQCRADAVGIPGKEGAGCRKNAMTN